MKNTIIFFLMTNFTILANCQSITAKFSADNCYAIYVGSKNSTTTKVLPEGNQNSVVNNLASKIFNATVKENISYSDGDYLYVIAWADDGGCQGLIGEFSGTTTIKTGEPGWEVYATGKDFNMGNAPNKQLVDQMITAANVSNKWV